MLSHPIPFPRRRTLRALAALCLGVVVFTYLLTLEIALFCLSLPVLLIFGGAFNLGGLVLGCMGLIIGGTILWSLLPRRDVFQVVGVEIDLAKQPRLKGLIEEIAGRIQQRPRERNGLRLRRHWWRCGEARPARRIGASWCGRNGLEGVRLGEGYEAHPSSRSAQYLAPNRMEGSCSSEASSA